MGIIRKRMTTTSISKITNFHVNHADKSIYITYKDGSIVAYDYDQVERINYYVQNEIVHNRLNYDVRKEVGQFALYNVLDFDSI